MQHGDPSAALDEAAEWFMRRDAGKLSDAENDAFSGWLAQPANTAAYAEIAGTWDGLAGVPRPARRPWVAVATARGLATAAVVLVAIGLGYVFDVPMRLEADAYTSVGEVKTVALPDGSTAVLNTDSAIAIAYAQDVRRVRLLRGEAVFTVAKNTSRPFLVDTAGGEARALGTAFDVRHDRDGATVAVLESKVAVTYPSVSTSAATVSPNEAVEYSSAGLQAVHAVDAEAETAWRRGKLIFVDRPLGEVVAEINRYHRGSIKIVDTSIRDRRVSGVFDTRDPVRVVDALEASLGLTSTRLTDWLILLHR